VHIVIDTARSHYDTISIPPVKISSDLEFVFKVTDFGDYT